MRHPLAGRLRLIDPIGEGGAGTVWRAWDPARRRFVAVKVGSYDASSLRVVRERSRLLEHPHVVLPHRWADDETTAVQVGDLVRGGTADRLLAEHGALPGDYVAVLLDQLLAALEAVHGAGLVHRDVKPANLLLEPTGTARPHLRLADLGIAAVIGAPLEGASGDDPASVPGTTGYLAPELASGARPHPRQDLYAAAITAAELLTGHRPRGPGDLPRGRWGRLLGELTDPDPERRPPTAAAARDLLGAHGVPPGAPWTARPHPPVVPDRYDDLRPPVDASTWAALAALACAVVLCALALLR